MKKTGLLLTLCLSVNLTFAALTPTEISLQQQVQGYYPEQLALLKTLVAIQSGTSNVKGVQAVGKKVEPYFKQLGFKTQWVELPSSMKHAGTFIARHDGQGSKIVLIGHLDTVFKPDKSFKPAIVDKHFMKGQGVIDDKGGLVTIIYALKSLYNANILQNANITVVLTGDEEDSAKPTSISRKALIEAAQDATVALDFEPSLSKDTVSTGRRGISNWTLKTTGTSSHSAEIFHEGVGAGAIFEMARILDGFRHTFSHNESLTVNPGLILGGTDLNYNKLKAEGKSFGKQNVIAKTAIAKGDMRFLSAHQKKLLEEKMQAIVNDHLSHTDAYLEFEDAIPAMPVTAANVALLKHYHAVSKDLGHGVVNAIDPVKKGAGDISHIASQVPANLAGLGPWGHGAHTQQETLELKSLTIQTERATLLLARLIEGK